MVKVIDAIAKAVAVPVFPISSSLKGEQIIYNIVPLTDDGIKQSNRLELNIIGKTMARAIELDTAIRQALLSIGDLKKNGVLVILDDFGTGYSNLHCLGDLRPNYIKIDRSFTLKALNNQYEHDLMTQIITMTHKLDLTICVEGIETEDEFAKISELDPDYIQGFLFGKPQPAEKFYENLIKPAIAACGTHEVSAQSVS